MHSNHTSLWKQAGIYHAVLTSAHKIHRNTEFIFALAERWSSHTNTFFFPWGEATLTLEDIPVLSGFPVSGDPISAPLQTQESLQIHKQLQENLRNLQRLKIDTHLQWLNLFMDSGSPIEHEAVLCLWLSRFVFPEHQFDKIAQHLFSIAIHLSRGRRLALAPSVLASLYRDLGLLKETITDSMTSITEPNSFLYLTLWSPLGLVQVWALERFPPLRPLANPPGTCAARVARWSGRIMGGTRNMREAIDSAGSAFLWRPYGLGVVDGWAFPSFYREDGAWIKGQDLIGESEDFVRCLRVSQLVGLDYVQPYNPHRVAMQFGFDQDLPAWICWEDSSIEDCWKCYTNPLNRDEVFYFPARLFEGDVTVRYLEWWRKTMLCPSIEPNWAKRRRRSNQHPPRVKHEPLAFTAPCVAGRKRLAVCGEEGDGDMNRKDFPDVPPGFEARQNATKSCEKSGRLKVESDDWNMSSNRNVNVNGIDIGELEARLTRVEKIINSLRKDKLFISP